MQSKKALTALGEWRLVEAQQCQILEPLCAPSIPIQSEWL